jgi:hypothetical protein
MLVISIDIENEGIYYRTKYMYYSMNLKFKIFLNKHTVLVCLFLAGYTLSVISAFFDLVNKYKNMNSFIFYLYISLTNHKIKCFFDLLSLIQDKHNKHKA